MFFIKKLKYKKLSKINIKKVYLKKKFNKLLKYSFFIKKKRIYKKKTIYNLKYNLDSFFYKFFKLKKKKKTMFYMNSFFFINIIRKKNNIFFNITNFKKDIIYSNSLKTLKILKKKKDMIKMHIISIFFLRSIKNFFKNFILDKIFKNLPNIYILSEERQLLILYKLTRVLLKFIHFFINLLLFPGSSNRLKKYLYSIKKTIKFLKYKKKIKIVYINIKYTNSFNGCRLRKLKRI